MYEVDEAPLDGDARLLRAVAELRHRHPMLSLHVALRGHARLLFTMGRELMAPITDRIPSGVASPVTTNHAATGSVFVNLRNDGNLNIGPGRSSRGHPLFS